jgi:putative peptidoglycan lipid II flippase
MTEDDWSPARIYGTPIPLPGDASALAVETSQPDTGDGWSTPSYHGPRRRRPRLVEHPAGPADGSRAAAGATAPPPTAPAAASGAAAPEAAVLPATLEAPGDPAGRATTVQQDRQAEAEADVEPAEAQGRQDEDEAAPSLLASSRTMAIASLVSRVTGFLRSVAIAAAVGAGIYSVGDAYGLANTLPNMVYELLLGGVLTSVLIPVLVKAQQDDEDRGVAYTQRLLSIATSALAAATLLAVLAAPWLIGIFGGPPQYRSVAGLWATLLLPEIFFYGLGAMIAAILNSRNIYGWPAWAPVLNNLITIAAALLFLLVPGPEKLSAGTITDTQILVLGIGTTLGIAAQALVLLVPLRRSGFVWQWRFRASPNEAGRMAEFRTLTLWVLAYVVISQLGVVVVNRVANQNGGVQIFGLADLLFMVPYGILGVSLLTALMPRMSRAAARGDTSAVLEDLRLGSRLSAVALIPISVGLMVFGPAFTSVILLGRFSQSNARLTGVALAAGAFGLVPFAVVMLQQRVFYAMRDARTPTFVNLAMVATKIALVLAGSQVLHGRAVIVALTVSTSTSYLVGCLVGHQLLRRRFGELRFAPVARTIGWISVAAAGGGVVGLLVVRAGTAVLGTGRVAALAELVVGGTLGGLVAALLAVRLPLPEVAQITSAIRSRTGRDASQAGVGSPPGEE